MYVCICEWILLKVFPAGLCSVFHCFLMLRHYQVRRTNVLLRHTVPFATPNTCYVSLPEACNCFDSELDYSVSCAFTKLKFPISMLVTVCRPLTSGSNSVVRKFSFTFYISVLKVERCLLLIRYLRHKARKT
jgi:hypothetical protein